MSFFNSANNLPKTPRTGSGSPQAPGSMGAVIREAQADPTSPYYAGPKVKGTPKKLLASKGGTKTTIGDEPPDVLKDNDTARTAAFAAAERQRKRAGAGSTVLTGLKMGTNPTPVGSFAPLTLVGGK